MFLHLFFHIWSVFISLLSLDSSFLRISRFWESLQFMNEDTKSRKFTWLVKSESGSEARIPIYKLSMVSFSLAPSCEWWPGLALLGKEQQTRPLFSRWSGSLRPHGLQPTGPLGLWDFPGKNIGVGCHFLLQGIFLTQGSVLAGGCFTTEPPGKPTNHIGHH